MAIERLNSFAFKNNNGQTVRFTAQDSNLLEAFHKVKRFVITDMKDMKGCVVSVRNTQRMPSCYVDVCSIYKKPTKNRKHGYWHFAEFISHGHYKSFAVSDESKTKVTNGTFVEDLTQHGNILFRYNEKVKAFIKLLEKADRFQQHCLLNNKPYNQETWQEYLSHFIYIKPLEDNFLYMKKDEETA